MNNLFHNKTWGFLSKNSLSVLTPFFQNLLWNIIIIFYHNEFLIKKTGSFKFNIIEPRSGVLRCHGWAFSKKKIVRIDGWDCNQIYWYMVFWWCSKEVWFLRQIRWYHLRKLWHNKLICLLTWKPQVASNIS